LCKDDLTVKDAISHALSWQQTNQINKKFASSTLTTASFEQK
jgi:hypothetical protein